MHMIVLYVNLQMSFGWDKRFSSKKSGLQAHMSWKEIFMHLILAIFWKFARKKMTQIKNLSSYTS